MAKQYTFKTTKETEWLEPILNGMGRLQRSQEIRVALIKHFGQVSDTSHKSDTQVTHVTQEAKLLPQVERSFVPTAAPNPPEDEPVMIIKEASEEDLEKKLDGLDLNFS